jgi:hypothetical protein
LLRDVVVVDVVLFCIRYIMDFLGCRTVSEYLEYL